MIDDPIYAEDKISDHNKIEELIYFVLFMKTLKMTMILVNLSYFLGMLWLIISDIAYHLNKSFYTDKLWQIWTSLGIDIH